MSSDAQSRLPSSTGRALKVLMDLEQQLHVNKKESLSPLLNRLSPPTHS